MALSGIDNWSPAATAIVLGVVTLFVALRIASRRKVHPNEPTVLPPWIPFIGHLLDPSLAAVIQRNAKVLSFTPLIPDITKRVLGLDDDTVKAIRQNLDPEPGDPRGFLADIHDVVYGALGPGQYLNSISCEASQELCQQLSDLAASPDTSGAQSNPVNLLQWVRHIVTVGSARYLYGPRNPIAEDPTLEKAFWAFDQGLGGLLMGIVPSITASEAYRGRERMVTGFIKYLDDGHIEQAAQISKDRVRVEREYGMSSQMIARSALSFIFAGIVNTTTTTFWVILRLFANRELLKIVRQEVVDALAASEEQHGTGYLSIGILKDRCPTLLAVFRESLRIGSENFSVRLIKEDTMVADRYFLKKDSVVQIAGGVIHADSSIWGDDVESFNPQRFMTQKAKSGGIHPAAFRGFGGGKTLCPGRHFATNEILLFAALIVHGFDMSSAEGDDIVVPPKNDRVMPVHILEPKSGECPRVLIKPRKEADVLGDAKIVI